MEVLEDGYNDSHKRVSALLRGARVGDWGKQEGPELANRHPLQRPPQGLLSLLLGWGN
jgi:hypothetical protein